MKRRMWTEAEDRILRKEYSRMQSGEIAARLGRTVRSVYTRASLMGLKKPETYRSEAGKKGARHPGSIATRFREGHVPANKGKRMPDDVYARCAPTMFREGNTPANHRPVGSERVNAGGYVEVKVAEPNKWRMKHRVVWEEANGLIPEGYNIQFRNRNRQDVRIENLYLISRAEQLREENSMESRYPEELRKVIRARGSLKRQITLHNRKRKQ